MAQFRVKLGEFRFRNNDIDFKTIVWGSVFRNFFDEVKGIIYFNIPYSYEVFVPDEFDKRIECRKSLPVYVFEQLQELEDMMNFNFTFKFKDKHVKINYTRIRTSDAYGKIYIVDDVKKMNDILKQLKKIDWFKINKKFDEVISKKVAKEL